MDKSKYKTDSLSIGRTPYGSFRKVLGAYTKANRLRDFNVGAGMLDFLARIEKDNPDDPYVNMNQIVNADVFRHNRQGPKRLKIILQRLVGRSLIKQKRVAGNIVWKITEKGKTFRDDKLKEFIDKQKEVHDITGLLF